MASQHTADDFLSTIWADAIRDQLAYSMTLGSLAAAHAHTYYMSLPIWRRALITIRWYLRYVWKY